MGLRFNLMMYSEEYLAAVSRVLQQTREKRQKTLAANPGADVSDLDFEIANLQDAYDYILENIEVWR